VEDADIGAGGTDAFLKPLKPLVGVVVVRAAKEAEAAKASLQEVFRGEGTDGAMVRDHGREGESGEPLTDGDNRDGLPDGPFGDPLESGVEKDATDMRVDVELRRKHGEADVIDIPVADGIGVFIEAEEDATVIGRFAVDHHEYDG